MTSALDKTNVQTQLTEAFRVRMREYVASMSEDDLRRWESLPATERVKEFITAFNNLVKDADWPANLPKFKRPEVQRDAVDTGITSADGRLNPPVTEFLAELGDAVFAADAVAAGGGYLYRNMDGAVPPKVVLGQQVFRGRIEPTDHKQALLDIYTDSEGAAGVLMNYVSTNVMTAGVAKKEVPCMSACTDADNTLGRKPTWQYAFPAPALSDVPLAKVQEQLGVSARQAASPAEKKWVLRSNSGDIDGAGVIAFVCDARADEHVFFRTVAIGTQAAFKAYGTFGGTESYRGRWKKLDDASVTRYWSVTEKYGLRP